MHLMLSHHTPAQFELSVDSGRGAVGQNFGAHPECFVGRWGTAANSRSTYNVCAAALLTCSRCTSKYGTPPGERFSEAERYIFDEIEQNRHSEFVNDLAARMTPPISAIDLGLAGRAWAEKVQTNGEWDHKPKIEELLGITSPNKLDPDHYFQQPGTKRSVLYDIYSNIHYGYIGKLSGIPTDVLIVGATRGTAETGQNDDGDLITMRGGAALFDKYGPNMTAEQFHTGLTDIINQLDAAKQAGKSVPQIGYLP